MIFDSQTTDGIFYSKGIKLIQCDKEIDTLALSLLTGLNISENNKKTSTIDNKIVILAPTGYIGKSNKKLVPLLEQVKGAKNIFALDKYTLKAEEFTRRDEARGITTSSDYLDRLLSNIGSAGTIIIASISPFVYSIDTQKNEIKEKFDSVYRILKEYAEDRKKNLIIIEENTLALDNLTALFDRKSTLETVLGSTVSVKNNKDSILEITPVSLVEKLALNPQQKNNETVSRLLVNTRKVTLDAIGKGTLRSLPLCSTGFKALDAYLEGGFEMGQVVSVVSENPDYALHFTLQMALQMPTYYRAMFISLAMNPRRFKEILDLKARQYEAGNLNSTQDKIQALTIDRLTDDGDIEEILDVMRSCASEEDVRVFFIDNDSLLSDNHKIFTDPARETDSVYKKLQIVANKHDILVVLISCSQDILSQINKAGSVNIDNSVKAIDFVKTQIVIANEGKVKVTKKMNSPQKTYHNALSSPTGKNVAIEEKKLTPHRNETPAIIRTSSISAMEAEID